MSDDGYHFPVFRDGNKDQWYTEWWYFNFIDQATEDSGFVVYQVTSPSGGPLPTRHGFVIVALYPGDGSKTIVETRRVPFEQFAASTTRPDVELGSDNTIRVLDTDTLHIEGAAGSRVRLKLEFQQRSQPAWLAHGSTGPQAWEFAYWMSYMPSAAVSGTIWVDGQSRKIQGAGYHDHNWGKWNWAARDFSWVACANPNSGVSLSFGVGNGFNPGYTAVLQHRGRTLQFPAEKMGELRILDECRYSVIWKIPCESAVDMQDESGNFRLDLRWKTRQTGLIALLPLVLFEHRCDVFGILTNLSTGEFEEFTEKGFCETAYSTI